MSYNPYKNPHAVTQQQADIINIALCGIYKVCTGDVDPQMYTTYEAALITPANLSLRTWLAATDFIDNWNKREQKQAQLAGREPNFVMTMRDDFIAALYTFISYPPNRAIIWNGRDLGLGITTVTSGTIVKADGSGLLAAEIARVSETKQ